jgi:hypothetical protein
VVDLLIARRPRFLPEGLVVVDDEARFLFDFELLIGERIGFCGVVSGVAGPSDSLEERAWSELELSGWISCGVLTPREKSSNASQNNLLNQGIKMQSIRHGSR